MRCRCHTSGPTPQEIQTTLRLLESGRREPPVNGRDRMRIPIAVQLALLVLLTAVLGVAVLAIATVGDVHV